MIETGFFFHQTSRNTDSHKVETVYVPRSLRKKKLPIPITAMTHESNLQYKNLRMHAHEARPQPGTDSS